MACWFALATWTLEVAILCYHKFIQGRVRALIPEAVVLGPFAYLLIFLVTAAIALGIARTLSPRRALRVSLFLLVLPAAWSPLLLFPRLHSWATLLLALGVAVQLSHVLTTRFERFQRVVRASLPPLAIGAGLVIVLVAAAGTVREKRAVAGLPPARAGSPNVLLIILDTVRAMSMRLYHAGGVPTPNLEHFARGGTVFDWPVSTASWTVPSHVSMFSGRLPSAMAVDWNRQLDEPLPGGDPVLAEVLGQRGYVTAGFVANLFFASDEFGLDRGFSRYSDYTIDPGTFVLSTAIGRAITSSGQFRELTGYDELFNRRSARDISDAFLKWSREQHERPFFAFLNYYDAHEPYLPPRSYHNRFGVSDPGNIYWYEPSRAERIRTRNLTPAQVADQLTAYEATIAYLDDELGRLLRALAADGVLDNTLVIITSDHGEEFAEHGVVGHGDNLFMTLLHVPLIVRFPKAVPAGQRIAAPVSLRDLPATVMDLLGVEDGRRLFPGRSLARHWQATAAALAADPIVSELDRSRALKSLVLNGRHLIVDDEQHWLFDYTTDPMEQTDLATRPAHADSVAPMMEALDSILAGASAHASGFQQR